MSEKIQTEIHKKISLSWELSLDNEPALLRLNRHLCLQLLEQADFEVSIISTDSEDENPLINEAMNRHSDSPAFTVRCQEQANFDLPASGKFILLQSGETDRLIEAEEMLAKNVDQIWVFSKFTQNLYEQNGIPAEKLKFIPPGIKEEEAINISSEPPIEFYSESNYKFLFIGNVEHPGADLLLSAYLKGFGKRESVSLIIIDTGQGERYDSTFRNRLQEIMVASKAAEILYFNQKFSEQELQQIYRASNCFIQPYYCESENFYLMEAMRYALPVITIDYGAVSEICPADSTYLLKSQVQESEALGKVYLAGAGALKRAMQHSFKNPEEAASKGKLAQTYVLENLPVRNSINVIRHNLKSLLEKPVLNQNHEHYCQYYHRQGQLLFAKEQFDKAAKYFHQAALLRGTFPENTYYLGLVELKKQNYEKAMQKISNALQGGLKIKEAYANLAFCLEKLGDVKTAVVIRQKYGIIT